MVPPHVCKSPIFRARYRHFFPLHNIHQFFPLTCPNSVSHCAHVSPVLLMGYFAIIRRYILLKFYDVRPCSCIQIWNVTGTNSLFIFYSIYCKTQFTSRQHNNNINYNSISINTQLICYMFRLFWAIIRHTLQELLFFSFFLQFLSYCIGDPFLQKGSPIQ